MSRSHEGPGEMGKAVNIPKDDQEKMKELFKINQFNLMASDMIALNRSLPDVRLDGCVSLSVFQQMHNETHNSCPHLAPLLLAEILLTHLKEPGVFSFSFFLLFVSLLLFCTS